VCLAQRRDSRDAWHRDVALDGTTVLRDAPHVARVETRDEFDTRVLSLSLGVDAIGPWFLDPLALAVEYATAHGVLVVTAAGNQAGTVTSPGIAPSALTVGSARTKGTATRSDDEISIFSSRGPTWYDGFVKPDVIAPGQALFATAVTGSVLSLKPGVQDLTNLNYIKLSGTSMSAGVASGVVATWRSTRWCKHCSRG
jgi:serine protease AprX